MGFHLAEIDLARAPGTAPSSFWEGVTAIERADCLQRFGYDDLATTDNESRVAGLRDGRDHRSAVMLALAGSAPQGPEGPLGHRIVGSTGDESVAPADILGAVFVEAPIHDNEHLGYIDLTVSPDHRGQGIGSALLSEGERVLSGWDRSTILGWSVVTSAVSEQTEGTIADPAGTVRLLAQDPGVRFPLNRGYVFSQAERHSVQPLPVPEDVLTAALAETGSKTEGYELVPFVGQPPADLLDGLAPLFAAMATDPPLGAVDWRPEVWDSGRVERAYEQMARGRQLFTMLARHVDSGEIAAFTQLKAPFDKPEVVYQENTLVLRQHRGHSLGLWIKAANCVLVSRERPSSRRVHTWNADENRYMLDVNTRLGYRREGIAAAWQKVLG